MRREFLTLQAEAVAFVGQLVWDASERRDHQTARSLYTRSLDIARHVGDGVLEGLALLRMGHVALYGVRDAHEGLRLSLSAAHAPRGASHALSAVARLHAGEAHAMLGQPGQCDEELEKADRHLARVDDWDAALDLISPGQRHRLAGSCHLSLGRYELAVRELVDAAAELPSHTKSRSIVLGNLALARIRQGEVDAGTAALRTAIEELEGTRGGGGVSVVFGAVRELRPWCRMPEVQDVHDRLFALMAGR
ncbi:transcriptional regulator [Streptomyces zingiberis]|nr:transcriptional regulator [Streptomyces zingiberis]